MVESPHLEVFKCCVDVALTWFRGGFGRVRFTVRLNDLRSFPAEIIL